MRDNIIAGLKLYFFHRIYDRLHGLLLQILSQKVRFEALQDLHSLFLRLVVDRRAKKGSFFFLFLKQYTSLTFQVFLRGHRMLRLLLENILPFIFEIIIIVGKVQQMLSKCAKRIEWMLCYLDCFKVLLFKRVLNCLFLEEGIFSILFNKDIFVGILFLFLRWLLVFRIERASTETCCARTFVEHIGIESK